MFTIFRHSFLRSRGGILGWGISLALIGVYLIALYDIILDQRAELENLIQAYPPELFAFFGGLADMFSPSGYIHTYFFSYIPLVLGIYAVLSGSGLLVSDEENGTLDLVMAHPVSRGEVFWGRLADFTVSLLLILAIAWLGFVLAIPSTQIEVTPGQLALPFLSLFAVMFVFAMLALLLSFLLPARRLAAMAAGIFLVASYFIESLANVDENLEQINRFLPLNYLQGGQAIDGLNWTWIGGLLAAAVGMALAAWLLFERRDIRVGGEGGWKLPVFKMRRRSPALTE